MSIRRLQSDSLISISLRHWYLVGLVGILSVLGCKSEDDVTSEHVVKKPVRIFVSCDTKGWIVPCGCSTKQSGGLLRRGSLVNGANNIVLDAGGAAAGNSEYHQVKFEAILKGEQLMSVAAHNIGASEAKFGAKTLREIAERLKTPFVSANVLTLKGDPVADSSRIVEKNGSRFLITGVLSQNYETDGLQIADPRQSILDLLDQHSRDVDGVIVLAYLDRDGILDLAKQLPEVDVIVGGPTGQTIAPTKVGATIVTAITNKGKFLSQIEFDQNSDNKWTAETIEVDDSYPDDPLQVNNLKVYHQVLAQRDFTSDSTGLSNVTFVSFDSKNSFVGNDRCASCHEKDCSHFTETKHAIAWKTLMQKQSHVDPYCQQCHTTGYGTATGFSNMATSQSLVNVGCESCHGPSSAHVANPKVRTIFQARDQCASCHDRENSPLFRYDEYWSRIVHGAKVTLAEQGAKQ